MRQSALPRRQLVARRDLRRASRAARRQAPRPRAGLDADATAAQTVLPARRLGRCALDLTGRVELERGYSAPTTVALADERRLVAAWTSASWRLSSGAYRGGVVSAAAGLRVRLGLLELRRDTRRPGSSARHRSSRSPPHRAPWPARSSARPAPVANTVWSRLAQIERARARARPCRQGCTSRRTPAARRAPRPCDARPRRGRPPAARTSPAGSAASAIVRRARPCPPSRSPDRSPRPHRAHRPASASALFSV